MDWYFVLQPFQFICSVQRFDISSHLQMISESVDTTRMTTFISTWWKSSYPSRRCVYNLGTLTREFTYWSHYKCLKYSGVLLTALAEKRFQRIVVLRRQTLVHLQPVIIKSYRAERFSSRHIKKTFLRSSGCIRLLSQLSLRGVPTFEDVLHPLRSCFLILAKAVQNSLFGGVLFFCSVSRKRQTLHCLAELILVLKATFADHFQ